MGLIFFVGVIPTALVMRSRGRNALRLDAAKASGTTWIERVPPGACSRHHEKPVLRAAAMSFLTELWRFLRVRKKFWLLPLLLMMALFGGLVVLTQGSAVAPFIYTLF